MIKYVLGLFAIVCVNSYAVAPFVKVDLGYSTFNTKIKLGNAFGSGVDKLTGENMSGGASIGLISTFDRSGFIGFYVGAANHNTRTHLRNVSYSFSGYRVDRAQTVKFLNSYHAGILLGFGLFNGAEIYISPKYALGKINVDIQDMSPVKLNNHGFGAELGVVTPITDTTSIGLSYSHIQMGDKVFTDSAGVAATEKYSSSATSLTLVQSF